MEHAFKQTVYYCDTDAYGVVWHGSYLRWLEMGRVYVCEMGGKKLSQLEKEDIILPVAEMNIKYKSSARLEDKLIIKTKIIEQGKFYFLFHQEVVDEMTNKTYVEATVKAVAIHKDGTLYRSLPQQVLNICCAKVAV